MSQASQTFSFNFKPGTILSDKYEVLHRLGKGWEGEVYIIKERLTGIERASKFFYPARNKNNKTLKFYAKKLHKLRNCSALIQYLTQETFEFKGCKINYLVSEYVEGDTLDEFIKKFPGKKMDSFQALHLFHSLIQGVEEIHLHREYHGDLHTGNIIVRRHGLKFDLKLIDFFHWGGASSENMKSDISMSIRVLYDILGGAKNYHKNPLVVKKICCGLKDSLIFKKFKNTSQLKSYLESLAWENGR